MTDYSKVDENEAEKKREEAKKIEEELQEKDSNKN